jgi:hypothetical protein
VQADDHDDETVPPHSDQDHAETTIGRGLVRSLRNPEDLGIVEVQTRVDSRKRIGPVSDSQQKRVVTVAAVLFMRFQCRSRRRRSGRWRHHHGGLFRWRPVMKSFEAIDFATGIAVSTPWRSGIDGSGYEVRGKIVVCQPGMMLMAKSKLTTVD